MPEISRHAHFEEIALLLIFSQNDHLEALRKLSRGSQSLSKWSATLLLTPPRQLVRAEPWSLEAQREENRRGKESHTPDDPKGSADSMIVMRADIVYSNVRSL